VHAELCLHDVADSARAQTECGILEFRNHLYAAEITQIAAIGCGRVFGELLGKGGVVFDFSCALLDAAGLFADLLDFFW
jgi:hypothetical protein